MRRIGRAHAGRRVERRRKLVDLHSRGVICGRPLPAPATRPGTTPSPSARAGSTRARTRLNLSLRAKRLGLSLHEAKALIDMYDSPRDTGPQLRKFLQVLGEHRAELEAQMAELQATLSEVAEHEKEARSLLARVDRPAAKKSKAN